MAGLLAPDVTAAMLGDTNRSQLFERRLAPTGG